MPAGSNDLLLASCPRPAPCSMHSWRIASSRGSTLLRPYALTPRRPLHTTPPRAQYPHPPRGAGLLPRVWFRPDGTPRSKLKGILFGTLGAASLMTLYSFADLVEEYDHANFLLSFLVYAQRVDAHYEQQDFSTYRSTRTHFHEMCCALPDAPQQVIDDFFDAIDEAVQVGRQEVVDQIHKLMVDFLRDAHAQLQQMEKDTALRTSSDILHALYDTITLMSRVHGDVHGGDDGGLALSTIIKQNKGKGADYEYIG